MRKAFISPRNALPFLVVLVVAMAYLAFQCYRSSRLQLRNDSDYAIHVDFSHFGPDGFDIGARSTSRSGANWRGASHVFFSSPDKPYWHWTCTWSDAKSHEPVVITNSGPNCAAIGSTRLDGVPLDLPTCSIYRPIPEVNAIFFPTATPTKASCGG